MDSIEQNKYNDILRQIISEIKELISNELKKQKDELTNPIGKKQVQ